MKRRGEAGGGRNGEGRSKAAGGREDGKEEVATSTRERKWKRKWCVERGGKKKERREGDGARGPGRQLGGRRGLSAFDVKSLRQKRSGPECCSTCSGNPRWRRQRGDGEDEGVEIKRGRKNRHEGDKMRKSQETRRQETPAGKLAILTKT